MFSRSAPYTNSRQWPQMGGEHHRVAAPSTPGTGGHRRDAETTGKRQPARLGRFDRTPDHGLHVLLEPLLVEHRRAARCRRSWATLAAMIWAISRSSAGMLGHSRSTTVSAAGGFGSRRAAGLAFTAAAPRATPSIGIGTPLSPIRVAAASSQRHTSRTGSWGSSRAMVCDDGPQVSRRALAADHDLTVGRPRGAQHGDAPSDQRRLVTDDHEDPMEDRADRLGTGARRAQAWVGKRVAKIDDDHVGAESGDRRADPAQAVGDLVAVAAAQPGDHPQVGALWNRRPPVRRAPRRREERSPKQLPRLRSAVAR